MNNPDPDMNDPDNERNSEMNDPDNERNSEMNDSDNERNSDQDDKDNERNPDQNDPDNERNPDQNDPDNERNPEIIDPDNERNPDTNGPDTVHNPDIDITFVEPIPYMEVRDTDQILAKVSASLVEIDTQQDTQGEGSLAIDSTHQVQASHMQITQAEETSLLPVLAPEIIVTAATPLVKGSPDSADSRSPHDSSVDLTEYEEPQVPKIVTFDDTKTETVIIMNEITQGTDDVVKEAGEIEETVENQEIDTRKYAPPGSEDAFTALIESPSESQTTQSETSEYEKAEDEDGSSHSEFERPPRFISSQASQYTEPDSQASAESLLFKKSLSRVLKAIDTIVYKDGIPMMWKKVDFSDTDILVPVPQNSMSSQVDEHRASKAYAKDSGKAGKLPREPIDSIMKRTLGLSAYRIVMGKPREPETKSKVRGIDWTRQLQMENMTRQPHYLYKEQWKQNQLTKHILGPGSYQVKDFIQLSNEKPRSERGFCDNLGPRYDKSMQSFTPGPGTYGIGGVPQRALEDQANRGFSTKGMLDTGDRKRDLPFVGGYLPPGTYNFKSFTEDLVIKNAKTHPPEYFPGDEKHQVYTGYFSSPKLSPMGPGHYKFKSFVDEMCNPSCHARGHFSKRAQYPDFPTERILLFSQQHHTQAKDTPSPAAYTLREFPKVKSVNAPGFLSSAERDDKTAHSFFAGNSHSVGPGRYNVEKYAKAQFVNGHTSVFKSKTQRANSQTSRTLKHRHHHKVDT